MLFFSVVAHEGRARILPDPAGDAVQISVSPDLCHCGRRCARRRRRPIIIIIIIRVRVRVLRRAYAYERETGFL